MEKFVIKPGFKAVNKTFRIPENIVEKLEKLASENKLSLNSLVIQCIEYAMEDLEKGGYLEEK